MNSSLKLSNRWILVIASILLCTGMASSCAKESLSNKAPESSLQKTGGDDDDTLNEFDGTYVGDLKTKDGKVYIFTDVVEDGEVVKSTVTDEDGNDVKLENIDFLIGTYYEESAFAVFMAYYDNYDCLYMTVEYSKDFPNKGDHYYYRVYGGQANEDGGCWYD